MNLDLPEHLHATRNLLMGSMSTHATEQAPALPTALLEDLTRSVTLQQAAPSQSTFANFVESLRSLVAGPAFGGAAAAIMVLAVVSTIVLRPDASSQKDTFRGAASYSAADSARVILVAAPFGLKSELEDISDFEDGVFSSAPSFEAASELEGARVIVDFAGGTIASFNAKGELVYKTSLPESTSGLSLEIAAAMTRF
jgi:hypothetical protein